MAGPWEKFQSAEGDGPWSKFSGAKTEPVKIGADGFADTLREELRNADPFTRNLVGAGTALSNLYEGAKQVIGFDGDKQRIKANRIIAEEAPIGAIAGNVAMFAPTVMIPGAAAVRGAAAIGAAQGALEPVLDNESRFKNAAIGAGFGAGGVAAGRLAAGVYRGGKSIVEPFTKSGQENIAARVMQRYAGDADVAGRNISVSGEIVPGSVPTIAEASRDAGLSQLQRDIANMNPQAAAALYERGLDNNAARLAALRTVSGDDAAMAAAIEARESATAPLRKAAMYNANVAGEALPKMTAALDDKAKSLVSALQDAGRMHTFEGQQRALLNKALNSNAPGWVSPEKVSRLEKNVVDAREATLEAAAIRNQRKAEGAFIKYQADSLAAHGNYPLMSSGIISDIDRMLNKPGMRSSDVIAQSLANVKSKIAALTNENGVIDANDLYTIRKEAGNVISKMADENANWDKRLASGLLNDIQGSIDTAIDKAGGGDLWKRYLSNYSSASRPINQMEIGQEIYKKATGAQLPNARGDMTLYPSQFGQAIKNGDALAKKQFSGNAGLGDVLEPDQIKTLIAIRDDLARQANAQSAGKAVGSNTVQNMAGQNILRQLLGPMGLPQGFTDSAILQSIMRPVGFAYKGTEEPIQNALAQLVLNPKRAEQVLKAQGSGGSNMEWLRYLLPATTGASAVSQ